MTLDTCEFTQGKYISIHMPHTWHDVLGLVRVLGIVRISIHMPHTWHD